MATKQTVLTDEGLRKLEEELELLKTVKRKEMADKIKTARSFGDLSENSEYDEAMNEQAIVESRISQIEAILKNVVILDESELKTDEVGIGSKVLIKDLEFKDEIEYQIVSSTEANPEEGKISDESPVGKAIVGKKSGQTVTVDTPGGSYKLKILKISK